MPHIIIRFLASFICCLPAFASAATTCSIHAEWTRYTPPSGYTVSGYRLYQEGQLACQTSNSTATAIDCQVTLNTNTTNFTLATAFTNGSESPRSAPFAFSLPNTTQTNTPPTAAFAVSSTSGKAPLNITFNGSSSSDSNGTITSYNWSFGDGSSAMGQSATHAYSTPGTFSATLSVTDNQGATSTASRTITVQADSQPAATNLETGDVLVSSAWARVSFESAFTNPIVIAGPPKGNNSDPCVVRIRNITQTGFDIRLTEWNYQDGTHPAETVSYLVLEKGLTTLPDGSIIEAGSFAGTTSFKTMKFSGLFAKSPVVLTTIASMNETDTISGRIKDVSLSSFAYSFREQEKNTNTHANETVNYIAWEPGRGTIGSLQFEAATTGSRVTSSWYRRSLQSKFKETPIVLADMQSTNNIDTSALRIQAISTNYFIVKVEEEQSLDSEVLHAAETVGYLAISPSVD